MNKGAAYWMDLRHFDDEDPIFLAQVQRGITNFVKILTGKDIPVNIKNELEKSFASEMKELGYL